MKKFLITLCALFMCATSHAQTETINWYKDGEIYATTQCESGGNIVLPNTPLKRGYTFKGWWSYTPIEYLESTGTQYIDTGVMILTDDRVFIRYKHTKNEQSFNNAGDWIAGTFSDNSSRFHAGWYQESWFVWDGFTYVSYGDNVYDANGIAEMDTKTNFYLFATNGFSTSMPIKIYFAKIYHGEELVRDFVPALDINGVACMFDKVSGTFFYNAGTGDFIAGPIVEE